VPVWSWMSFDGPGDLQLINGTLDSGKYVKILDEVFLPEAIERFGENYPFPFIHDNSSIHTANVVKEWVQDHPEVEMIKWPAKAADLNPIENAWAWLKRRSEPQHCKTKAELFEKADGVWNALGERQSLWENLVSSMPDRMNECCIKRGGWTGY